jgi:hypothetical protein
MDYVEIYGPFEVAPEWQEHIPDEFGVSQFDRWRWHIEDALKALVPLHKENRSQIAPGFSMEATPYRIEFHPEHFHLYWGAFLLARVECQYADDRPNPPKPFSSERTRGNVPRDR